MEIGQVLSTHLHTFNLYKRKNALKNVFFFFFNPGRQRTVASVFCEATFQRRFMKPFCNYRFVSEQFQRKRARTIKGFGLQVNPKMPSKSMSLPCAEVSS